MHILQKIKGGIRLKRLLCCILICMLSLPLPAAKAEEEKYLALTFDDGPSGRFTTALLDGLAERNVKATFFLCGYRVDQFPTLTGRIAREGHEIGVHGDKHRFFTQMSASEVCEDLHTARKKICAAAGREPTLLRPPGGLYQTAVLKQTDCAKLPIILWSVDPRDWCHKNENEVSRCIISNAQDGDIILMHDMSDSSVHAALRVIDTLQAQGFHFVTVSELASHFGERLEGANSYSCFRAAKKASISAREAQTEPCTKPDFPPPLPCRAAFSALDISRKSPPRSPRAYL